MILPNENKGKHRKSTKLTGFEESIDNFLRNGTANSQVIFDSIIKEGYKGGPTTVKNYISANKDLIPSQRILVLETPNRGRLYETETGEMLQMDWGFIEVQNDIGNEWQCACFAMVCHHCGL